MTDSNYNSSIATQSKTLNITKATSSFTWTSSVSTLVYGSSLTSLFNAVPLNSVFDNATPIGTITYSTTGFSNLTSTTLLPYSANPYTITATLTVTDSNYNSSVATQSKTLSIFKATPIISWTPNLTALTYGTALSNIQHLNATVPTDYTVPYSPIGSYIYSISTIGNVSNGTILPASNSAGYYIVATLNLFNIFKNNYVDSITATSGKLIVAKAAASFIWNNQIPSLAFQRTLTTNHLSAIALDPIDNITSLGTISYSSTPTIGGSAKTITTSTNNLAVGAYNVTASLLVTNPNYQSTTLSYTNSNQLNITKEIPNFVWNNSISINYGTPLSSSNLNAASPIDTSIGTEIGTISYGNSIGRILSVGTHIITAYLTVTLATSPNDFAPGIYSTTNTITIVSINSPLFTWNTYLPELLYSTPLSSSQLNAMAIDPVDGRTILGNITYNYQLGQILNAGIYTIIATLNITNPNYISSTQTASNILTVVPKVPSVIYDSPRAVLVGTAITSRQLYAQTDIPNCNISYNISLGTIVNAPITIIASVNPPFNNPNFKDIKVSDSNLLSTYN